MVKGLRRSIVIGRRLLIRAVHLVVIVGDDEIRPRGFDIVHVTLIEAGVFRHAGDGAAILADIKGDAFLQLPPAGIDQEGVIVEVHVTGKALFHRREDHVHGVRVLGVGGQGGGCEGEPERDREAEVVQHHERIAHVLLHAGTVEGRLKRVAQPVEQIREGGAQLLGGGDSDGVNLAALFVHGEDFETAGLNLGAVENDFAAVGAAEHDFLAIHLFVHSVILSPRMPGRSGVFVRYQLHQPAS